MQIALSYTFLALFEKFAESHNYLRHVCPSVRMQQMGIHWTDFFLNYIFPIYVDTIQLSLKSDKNNRYLHAGQ